mgnify:CR=1 FL=1
MRPRGWRPTAIPPAARGHRTNPPAGPASQRHSGRTARALACTARMSRRNHGADDQPRPRWRLHRRERHQLHRRSQGPADLRRIRHPGASWQGELRGGHLPPLARRATQQRAAGRVPSAARAQLPAARGRVPALQGASQRRGPHARAAQRRGAARQLRRRGQRGGLRERAAHRPAASGAVPPPRRCLPAHPQRQGAGAAALRPQRGGQLPLHAHG